MDKEKNEQMIEIEENEDKYPQKTIREVRLPRCRRMLLFFLIIFIDMGQNFSSGILSSASSNIKSSLKINDKEFGMFGSANGLGRVFGSMLFTLTINCISRKLIVIIFLLLNTVCLILSKISNDVRVLIALRGLIGVAHMPPSIYIPVWIDQYGQGKYKTILMTIYQVVSPLGKVIGFGIHICVGEDNWQMGFIVEAIFLLFLIVCFTFTPNDYFSSTLFVYKKRGRELEDKGSQQINIQVEDKERDTMFIEVEKKEEKKKCFISDFHNIITNPQCIITVVIRAFLLGALSSIHYWIGDYMRNVLLISNQQLRFRLYFFMAAGGPCIGIILGSIVRLFVPSYEQKSAEFALIILHIISCFFAMCIPFRKSLYSFCCAVMLYLAFSAVTLPFVEGSIATSVIPQYKASAFAFASLFHMLLTSGPFPVIYGIINDKYGKSNSSIGMLSMTSIYSSSLILILIYLGIKYIKRNLGKKICI